MEKRGDLDADAGRCKVEHPISQDAGGNGGVVAETMTDNGPVLGLDNQVLADRGQAEIVLQLGGWVTRTRRLRKQLDHDKRIKSLDRVVR